MSFKITNRGEFTKGIKQETLNKLIPSVLRKAQDNLIEIVQDEVYKAFGRNEIVRGILGEFAGDEDRDVQAIFGLSDSLVKDFIYGVKNDIENNLDIKVSRDPRIAANVVSVKISNAAKERFIKSLFDSPYSSYLNENARNSFEIPWLKWLIEGYSTEASIEFDINSSQSINSRSGRALMQGDDGWQWSGVNFISEIFADSEFIEAAEQRIKFLMEYIIGNE